MSWMVYMLEGIHALTKQFEKLSLMFGIVLYNNHSGIFASDTPYGSVNNSYKSVLNMKIFDSDLRRCKSNATASPSYPPMNNMLKCPSIEASDLELPAQSLKNPLNCS